MITATFRSLIRWLVPGWLNSGDGEKHLQVLAALIDASTERLRLGMLQRYPSYAGEAALALIGKARGIVRGRVESAGRYATRLAHWRFPRGHRVRGSAEALLEQVGDYFGGTWCATSDRNGNVFQRAADGTVTVTHGATFAQPTDYPPEEWGRFWLFIQLPGSRVTGLHLTAEWSDLGADDTWGGALGTPGTVIGMRDWSPEDTEAIRGLFVGQHPWKPEGVWAEWLVVTLDPAYLSTEAPPIRWAKVEAGHTVPARERAHCRYIALVKERNLYLGDPDTATNYCDCGDLFAFEGDPASFPGNAVLPDGTVYAGDPASFPVIVQLPDDGDLP